MGSGRGGRGGRRMRDNERFRFQLDCDCASGSLAVRHSFAPQHSRRPLECSGGRRSFGARRLRVGAAAGDPSARSLAAKWHLAVDRIGHRRICTIGNQIDSRLPNRRFASACTGTHSRSAVGRRTHAVKSKANRRVRGELYCASFHRMNANERSKMLPAQHCVHCVQFTFCSAARRRPVRRHIGAVARRTNPNSIYCST